MAWLLIGLGICIWFCSGLFIMTRKSKNINNDIKDEVKIWKHPINNKQYKKFLKSPAWTTIEKIAVESDYSE